MVVQELEVSRVSVNNSDAHHYVRMYFGTRIRLSGSVDLSNSESQLQGKFPAIQSLREEAIKGAYLHSEVCSFVVGSESHLITFA